MTLDKPHRNFAIIRSELRAFIFSLSLAILGALSASPYAAFAQEVQKNGEENSLTTVLNVKDADIATLVKTFSKITKRNYIVDSTVNGKVTIHLPTAVTIPEALSIFDTVLLLKGFTTVPVGDNIWKVVAAKDAAQTTIPLVKDATEPPTDVLVTRLVRLKYVRAEDMQNILGKFVGTSGVMNAFPGTNSLILIDSHSNIERIEELVAELDVPARDQELTIIPVEHANAVDLADKVNEILGEEKSDSSGGSNPMLTRATPTNLQPRTIPGKANDTEAKQTGSPLKVIPDERTNSLIVVADVETTERVRSLVEQLDSPLDLSGGRFFVYRLRHADAEELSEILNSLISGSGSSSTTSQQKTTGGSSLTRTSATDQPRQTQDRRLEQVIERRRQLLGLTTTTNSGDKESGRVNFEGDVSIAPDPSTNSLIINASRSDFLRIKELVDELDVKRRQVLVEATILEVSLTREEDSGTELQGSTGGSDGGVIGQTNFGGLTELVTNPAALSDLTIAAASTGTITLPGGLVLPSQALLISALSRNSNVNVLSAPNLLTTDNQEAQIIVGENVPFVTSTSTDPTNLNNTFNQIERQDVGITLRITPQISTGHFVTLKVFVEISNVVAGTRNDPNGPTTTIRTTETTVEVKNGQMVVMGGLIADNVTQSKRGIPYLQDVPVLGHLFKQEGNDERRTNLLIFITPRIIKDQYDARETTVAMRDSFKSSMRDSEPIESRKEVLYNENIDRVVEPATEEYIDTPIIRTPPAIATSMGESDDNANDEMAIKRTFNRLNALEKSPNKPNSAPPTTANINSDSTTTPQSAQSEDIISVTVRPELPKSGLRQVIITNSDSS
ncbi:MAG: type II secretion system secretin GspD [Deltaproteobacteria bacterium]|nr:type II secretion system secretin GspD [Deltaproteobacteria bacterium]